MKTTRRFAIVFALVVAGRRPAARRSSGAPPAAPALALTLDEAVRRAVDHNPDLTVVRLGTEIQAAQVGESRGAYTPVFSSKFGRSSNVTPPTNALLGDQRRRHARLVLVDRRAAARAVGQRDVERLVGRVADDQQQSAEQLRPEPAVRAGGRVLATADPRSKDRRGAPAVLIAKRNRSDLRAAVPRNRRRHDGGSEAGLLDAEGDCART